MSQLQKKSEKKFQFHTGSIKSWEWAGGDDAYHKFQFHTGSIKRNQSKSISAEQRCFNSILVRLKVAIVRCKDRMDSGFNSILVRLKGVRESFATLLHTGFNSILVRLKGYEIIAQWKVDPSFNSILVRLKVDDNVRMILPPSEKFQFHTGSIKRQNMATPSQKEITFQFHTGSIKSVDEFSGEFEIEKFQFHTGSIKSAVYVISTGVSSSTFQFHTGSIKRVLKCDVYLYGDRVSIPYWFD